MSERIEFEIASERHNPLLGRRELIVRIKCKSTPSRHTVREAVAKRLLVGLEAVYVRRIRMETGKHVATGEIHVYESPKRALQIEQEHVRLRNTPPKEKHVERESGSEEEGKEG